MKWFNMFAVFLVCLVLTSESHALYDDCGSAMGINTSHNVIEESISPAGEYDFFRFEVTGPGVITFYTSGDNDTYGYLYDNTCSAITSNDDDGDGYNFHISEEVPFGHYTYYAVVRFYNSSETGDYTLFVNFQSDGSIEPGYEDVEGDTCSEALLIDPNSATDGSIYPQGDIDFFEVHVSTPGTLELDSTSSSPWIWWNVHDSQCDILESDSLISYEIEEAGTYYISVSGLYDCICAYTLYVNFYGDGSGGTNTSDDTDTTVPVYGGSGGGSSTCFINSLTYP